MAKTQKPSVSTGTYRHKSASRRNAPTTQTESMMKPEARAPKPFTVDRRKVATPVLAWDRQGETSSLTGDRHLDARHDFTALPLYIREKINPAVLVEQLRKPGSAIQRNLLDDFNGLPPDADSFKFYEHTGHWQNRLIHGDSAEVMKSLIAKDGLAGQVQMIYYDPPYGMSYQSNFQPSTDNLDVKDKAESVPVGDALPIKAFHDAYKNGIDSYLDGAHKQCVLFRELLTDSGSLFVQIGDENVHRLAVLLDEIFGANNRIATITWRSTGGSSSKTIPETASYLLWYAKDRKALKFNHLFEPRDRQQVMNHVGWTAGVEMPDGGTRAPTPDERRDATNLPPGARIFQRTPVTSMGHSTTDRSVDFPFEGTLRATGVTRQWRVSVCQPTRTNGGYPADDKCTTDPKCGMHVLAELDRLSATPGDPKGLCWKWYEDEMLGNRLDNVWVTQARPRQKRYVVQTASVIIERCMLMTTEPGDLVFDPTCGSGATADAAESWGRRWITCDVQRVAVAVARSHLLTKPYPWHKTKDGNTDPSVGFIEETMPRVSAATLAYGTVNDPENQIRLVDRTEIDTKKVRVCSPFTVESISPYHYVPLGGGAEDDVPVASLDDTNALLSVLRSTPVCDANGRPNFDIVETTPWPDNTLVSHGAKCSSARRDEEFNAAIMVAASDATVTKEVARRSAIEARENDPDCEHLVIVGYEFESGIPSAVAAVNVHCVVASKHLQLPETIKTGPDGGSFTLLAEPDCHVSEEDDGSLVVELLGCDVYDPATGHLESSNLKDIDCWMIDTNHDSLSFFPRLIYYPCGLHNYSGFKQLMKSLKKDLDPEAEAKLFSYESQPFPPPTEGNNIAVKVITTTGAEMTATIEP